MKLKLIDNWRSAWRYIVVKIGLALVAWSLLPEETRTEILRALLRLLRIDEGMLPAVIGVLVIVGRMIAQPNVPK